MENFNAKKIRNNLAKKLKDIRKGSIKDKVINIFSSEEKSQEKLEKRHETARKYLDSNSWRSWYKEAKDIIHPEIQIKKQEELRRQVREKFGTVFIGFEDLLENNNIVDKLIKLKINKVSKITKEQMDFMPEANMFSSYTDDGDWVGGHGNGTSAFILSADKSNDKIIYTDVPQAVYETKVDAYFGHTIRGGRKFVSSGRAVKDVVPKDRNSIVIINYDEDQTSGFVFVERSARARVAYLYNGKNY